VKSLKIAAATAYAPRESFKFNSAPRSVKLYFGSERKKEKGKEKYRITFRFLTSRETLRDI